MSNQEDEKVFETKEEAVTSFVQVYLQYEAEIQAYREQIKEVREAIKETKGSPSYTQHLSSEEMKQIILAIKLVQKEEDLDKVKEFFDKLTELGVV